MRRKWYLSGSVTNDPDFRDKFAYAEFQLKKRGLRILNPVKHEKDGKEWSYYLRKDLRKLTRCQGIIMLDDWENSKSSKRAKLELKVAQELGLDIMEFDCITGYLHIVFQEITK